MRFLNDSVFKTPSYLIHPEIAARIEQAACSRASATRRTACSASVLQDQRLNQLIEAPALAKNHERCVLARRDARRSPERDLVGA